MILGPDGARLSKRHGAVGVMQYRDDGYLPQALLNYLVRLGWSHGDQEVFSVDQMISLFDIRDVNRKASAFNTEKLDWLNQHYMKTLPAKEVAEHLAWYFEKAGINPEHGPPLADLVSVQADRVKTLREMTDQSRIFYEDYEEFDAGAAKKHLRPVAEEPLRAIGNRLADLEIWEPERLHQVVRITAEELEVGMGKIAQPLRVALTGTAVSPSIDQTLWLVGRDRSLARIRRALQYVMARAAAS
jgi:glutamyl-tRNA synthetase